MLKSWVLSSYSSAANLLCCCMFVCFKFGEFNVWILYLHHCLTPSYPSDSSSNSQIRGLLVLKHCCYIHTHEYNPSPISTTYMHMCLEMITWYWITDLQASSLEKADSCSPSNHLLFIYRWSLVQFPTSSSACQLAVHLHCNYACHWDIFLPTIFTW